ncbi:hypothetical protein C8Q74DRAFT_1220810 [Fomes fomentarius]|nr:hypothetical protein C8Q74DRAFT_1220810 [Fomes fomentarius]
MWGGSGRPSRPCCEMLSEEEQHIISGHADVGTVHIFTREVQYHPGEGRAPGQLLTRQIGILKGAAFHELVSWTVHPGFDDVFLERVLVRKAVQSYGNNQHGSKDNTLCLEGHNQDGIGMARAERTKDIDISAICIANVQCSPVEIEDILGFNDK